MTDQAPVPPWLAEDAPFDDEQSRAQVDSVLSLLGKDPVQVLELGCGGGRIMIPLAAAGHHVTGIDMSEDAIERCRERCSTYAKRITLVCGDFRHDSWSRPKAGYDTILLLGNTLMTLTDPDEAISLFANAAEHLAPGGSFLIDDIAGCFWPELTEGNWQSGLSEDGTMQLIWHPRDTLFTIRLGDQVDTASWDLRPTDRLFRLWTSSLLAMVAERAGLSEPKTADEHILTVMRRADGRAD